MIFSFLDSYRGLPRRVGEIIKDCKLPYVCSHNIFLNKTLNKNQPQFSHPNTTITPHHKTGPRTMKLDFSVEPHYIQLHALEQHGRIMLTLPEGVKKDELRTYCCSLGVINKSTYYVRKTEQANVFLIQRNDPRNPRNPHRSSYPYDALDCGQHFSIPKFQEYSQNSLRVHTYTEGKRLGKKFKVHEDKKNALYTITRTN